MNKIIKNEYDAIKKGSGYVDQFEREYFHDRINRVYFPSNYNFLKSHNGFRPSEVHIFMSYESGGKSTLIRSILLDIISREVDSKIMVFLSEESIDDFKMMIAYSGLESIFLKNVDIYSEQDHEFKNPVDMLKAMYYLTQKNKYDIILFDNITTSICYTYNNGKSQADVSVLIKRMMGKLDIPLIIVAHSDSDASKNRNMIMQNSHIRGNKTLPNLAQYFYILQNVIIDGARINFLRITKHRTCPNLVNSVFRLFYSPEKGIFNSDIISSNSEFLEKLKLGAKQ